MNINEYLLITTLQVYFFILFGKQYTVARMKTTLRLEKNFVKRL